LRQRLTRVARSLLPLLAIVAVPIVIVAVLFASAQGSGVVADLVAAIREAAGEWWAVPLFILLYAVFAVFLIPVTPLAAAAALAWGWKLGGAIDLLAATIGSLLPFYLARNGLAPRLTAFLERRGVHAPWLATSKGTFALLILRVLAIIPYVALNYLAGLARFRTRDYVWTMAAGTIPSAFLFAWFVDTMGAGASGMATHVEIIAACAAVALFAIIVRIVARHFRPRPDADPPAPPT
jgi:uncharacterized membrane protein YdjX (TVP38/TMEM64 family)